MDASIYGSVPYSTVQDTAVEHGHAPQRTPHVLTFFLEILWALEAGHVRALHHVQGAALVIDPEQEEERGLALGARLLQRVILKVAVPPLCRSSLVHVGLAPKCGAAMWVIPGDAQTHCLLATIYAPRLAAQNT
jgi:hypothetical protein